MLLPSDDGFSLYLMMLLRTVHTDLNAGVETKQGSLEDDVDLVKNKLLGL